MGTDRKQEYHSENRDPVLMEIIQDWMREEETSSYALYDCIAPLMQREFPREKFEALLLRFSGMDIASAWLDDCQSIWEGDHIAEVRKKACHKCGGDGWIPEYAPNKPPGPSKRRPCPQCDGTGEERRSGDERRRNTPRTFNGGRRNYDYEGVALFVDVAGKGYEEQHHYDRRTLSDRRES